MRIFLNHSSRSLNHLRYLQTAVRHRKPQVAAVTYKRKPQKKSENWGKRVRLHILFKAYDVQFHNCIANVEVILTVEMYFNACIQSPNSYLAIAVRRIYSYVGMSAGYAFVNLLNLFCNGFWPHTHFMKMKAYKSVYTSWRHVMTFREPTRNLFLRHLRHTDTESSGGPAAGTSLSREKRHANTSLPSNL